MGDFDTCSLDQAEAEAIDFYARAEVKAIDAGGPDVLGVIREIRAMRDIELGDLRRIRADIERG
ncbi:hypothetical protein PSm6_00150 [Pseudomonas solani]|uniref:Uncharacterized protein n=1 Tax=Pseudomonas solani TaxID=2731552 RepID=A0ABM7L293_9PSED|nr:hypothetical protein [Pseudomonas solani]BCD83608.1 hypothetical protein PSm6_00150 [Pseudomonas solani]